MGDRSNIVIQDSYNGEVLGRVYLYGHWMGPGAIDCALHGLRSGRSTDAAYLARIIFSDMIRDDIDGETGYGITATMTDNEYPVIVIDAGAERVWIEDWTTGNPVTRPVVYPTFIKAANAALNADEYERYDALIAALPTTKED